MLIEAGAAAFADLIAGSIAPPLVLAEPGWESAETLAMLRQLAESVRARFTPAAWLIVEDREVVGLCSIIKAPETIGLVEIGYGIAPSRRGRGAASRAVGDVLAWARADARVTTVTADTSIDNVASQRVLARNGFLRVGTRTDAEDGDMICWSADSSTSIAITQ
jgi:RimJ/RimL family protein N-acetyltransferase